MAGYRRILYRGATGSYLVNIVGFPYFTLTPSVNICLTASYIDQTLGCHVAVFIVNE